LRYNFSSRIADAEMSHFSPAEEIAAWQLAVVLALGIYVFSKLELDESRKYTAVDIAEKFNDPMVNPEDDAN
jgi:hypothetical protein